MQKGLFTFMNFQEQPELFKFSIRVPEIITHDKIQYGKGVMEDMYIFLDKMSLSNIVINSGQ